MYEVINLIATILNDVQKTHADVFDTRARNQTFSKVQKRVRSEGISFITKTLPKLGKCFDKALAGEHLMTQSVHGFKPMSGSELPKFLGELFIRVFDKSGTVLRDPCAKCIASIRQVLYPFYKYKLPYSKELEQVVVSKFEETEKQLSVVTPVLDALSASITGMACRGCLRCKATKTTACITRTARIYLQKVFRGLDLTDIVPRHGPGVVSTKEKLWAKYHWTNICGRITDVFPLDEYFYASVGHVVDRLDQIQQVNDQDLPARVLLVPKDSRGPRLISCEPVDFQWIQQGIMRRLVNHIEHIDLTRGNVFFTDQQPNQRAALYGSINGRYSTLDLNEASDRVSVSLVRLLFPEHVQRVLLAARSSSTVLPNGKRLDLQKFAPMGSALCFPIMALTIWSLLTAAAPDAYTRERILVYGDDIIVPTAFAADAMTVLESFGLKVNRDKSCTGGSFRESCGVEAFKGHNVTPVRFRTPWKSSQSASVYTSWIAYANSFYSRGYFETYDLIVEMLTKVYREIPTSDMLLTCPSLPEVPPNARIRKRRVNKNLQKVQYWVRVPHSPKVKKEIDGWEMLLRFFSERGASTNSSNSLDTFEQGIFSRETTPFDTNGAPVMGAFSASTYTPRRRSMLRWRWR